MLQSSFKLFLLLAMLLSGECFIRPINSRMVSRICKETHLNAYPIHIAAEDGDLEKVKALVNADKSLLKLVETEGNIALHFAAKWGYYDMVVFLVENGAEINFKNDRGRTSLHLSTNYEDLEISKYLVSKGGDLLAKNKDKQTPLQYAKKAGFDKELLAIAEGVPIQPKTPSRGDW